MNKYKKRKWKYIKKGERKKEKETLKVKKSLFSFFLAYIFDNQSFLKKDKLIILTGSCRNKIQDYFLCVVLLLCFVSSRGLSRKNVQNFNWPLEFLRKKEEFSDSLFVAWPFFISYFTFLSLSLFPSRDFGFGVCEIQLKKENATCG